MSGLRLQFRGVGGTRASGQSDDGGEDWESITIEHFFPDREKIHSLKTALSFYAEYYHLVNHKDDSKSSRFAIALARYEAEVVDGNGLVGCDVM